MAKTANPKTWNLPVRWNGNRYSEASDVPVEPLTITGSGFGTKGTAQIFEDFENISVGSKSVGAIGTHLVLSADGGTSVIDTLSASGSRCLSHDYGAVKFPHVYKVASGTSNKIYMSCKFRIASGGTGDIWKMGRFGANAVYTGVPHAGSSYQGTTPLPDGFTGEIVTSAGITSWAAQNTSTADPALVYVTDSWMFYECELYCGTVDNSDAVFFETINGTKTVIWQNRPYLTTANSALPTWALTPINGFSNASGVVVYVDDLYIDESRARVVMTDNASFGSSTKFEIQPVTTWSDTEIACVKRRGNSFAVGATVYVHVFNDAGTLVSTTSVTA